MPRRLRARLALGGEAAAEGQRGLLAIFSYLVGAYESMEPGSLWSCEMKDKGQ